MKIAVTMVSMGKSYSEGKTDVRSFIEFCRKIGVDGVDLLEYYWKDKSKEVKEVPKWLQDNNLILSAYAVGNDFTKADKSERQKQIDYVKRGIDTAADLGADKMRIFGGHPLPGLSREDCLNMIIDSFYPCVEYAAECGVVLSLENHGDMPGRSEEEIKILKAINSPYLKCNIDVANFMAEHMEATESPVVATQNLISYVVHSHVKDIAYFPDNPKVLEGCVLGEGIVPLKECLQVFKNAHYRGYLSLEFEGQKHIDEATGVRKSIVNLKALLNELD